MYIIESMNQAINEVYGSLTLSKYKVDEFCLDWHIIETLFGKLYSLMLREGYVTLISVI